MRVTVVTPPSAPVIDAPTIRARLGITDPSEDAVLAALVASATATLDAPTGWLGCAIGRQTLKATALGFGDPGQVVDIGDWCEPGAIKLPFPPIVSIETVSYVDANGVTQTLDPSAYALSGRYLMPAYGTSWPTARIQANAVQITYVAGYSPVPEPIVQAIVLGVSKMRALGRTDASLRSETTEGVGSWSYDTGGGFAETFDRAAASLLSGYRVFD